ncbi:hypothetical protein B0H17DRAFT_453897 [Mycena rosella]|uniref:F-box domain-containing protein n=1 Tax=Mycena rosella TaxID=1033263 RepID=A0AAD7GZ84_MYCRO|nr:hypothetical protein B0H17DRAFT_453897 [Mycena rosella]
MSSRPTMLSTTEILPRHVYPEPRRCLFAMCTHALPQEGCIVDPVGTIHLKTAPARPQSDVCKPYRYVPQVPQEIIDAIVESVEDLATFKACSLVCWAFVPASRTHIFRTVSLDMLNDAPDKIHAMLLRSPHIALYVRDLTIYRSHDTTSWMRPGSPLPAVLAMLPHIQRFSIFGCWGDWGDIPAPLATALLHIVALPKLERLHVLTIANVPAIFLHHALSLRVLSLFYVSLDPTMDTRDLPARVTSPEYLNLSLDSKVGKLLAHVGAAPLAAVRRLALNPIPNSPHSAAHLAKVLRGVEGTLERLDLQVHELHWTHPDTARLRALRTLQLHVIMESPRTPLPAFLPGALARFRAANPLLAHLTVVLHLPGASVCGADVPGAGDAARLLRACDAQMGGLKEVRWRVNPEASPPSLVPDYAAFLRAHLPRTEARGVLKVEQGYRVSGAAVMPLLPYTSVWPHRGKK